MILDRLFSSRAVTVPPINPTGFGLFDMVSPGSQTGLNINEFTALQMSAVYACIRVLSETLAQLPLNVYRRIDIGSEIDRKHPLHNVLHNTPNPWMTSFTWRNTVHSHVCGWGNGYTFIIRDQRGQPRALLPLLPDRTFPQLIDNVLTYRTEIGNHLYEANPADIIHIPGLAFDGLFGQSPIALHREAIGLGQAAQTFGARLFGSGSLLSGILTHPQTLKRKSDNPNDPSPVERLRRQFHNLYSGLENAGKVAVLEEGMDFKTVGVPPEDAQFLQTRKFQVADIARIFNVPSHLINDLDKATFNNISELSLSFIRYNITPWVIRWEQELNRKLFPHTNSHYVKFNLQGLLRGTITERSDYYKTAIEYGWLSRNEVRELEELNRVDGLDEYLQPLNMGSGQKSEALQ